MIMAYHYCMQEYEENENKIMIKRCDYDNLEKRIFDGVGEYDIPQIEPTAYEGGCDWIGFNYAKSCNKPSEKGVHFFSGRLPIYPSVEKYKQVYPYASEVSLCDVSGFLYLYRFSQSHADI